MLFSINPVTYIRRAIPKFNSAGFSQGEQHNRFTTDKRYFLEIDGEFAFFPCEHFSHRIQTLLVNLATHAEKHKIFCGDKSVDSVGHRSGS
jgi:hypothetical protein